MRELLLICTLIYISSSLKILVYSPKFGFSHMHFMGSVADTLQLAGHDVTIVQPVISPQIMGTGAVHSKVISIPATEEIVAAMGVLRKSGFFQNLWSMSFYNPMAVLGSVSTMQKSLALVCDNMLNQTDILEELKSVNFDLAIAEAFDASGFALFHAIGVSKIVPAHSTGLFEGTALAIGVPLAPSYVPGSQSVTGDSGSLWDRIVNLVFTYFSHKFQLGLAQGAQDVMDKRFPEAPTIMEMIADAPFVLTNSEPLLDFPHPTTQNVVDLGGIGLRASKPLDKHWTDILSLRPQTVLFSFGSVAPSSTMPLAMKESIIRTMKKFPDVTFIWKYETPEDGIADGADNVVLSKWTPQTDLLGSGGISLFVTHGGAGSTIEASANGVPLVVVPLFGDQMRNAKMIARLGNGIPYQKPALADEFLLESTLRGALGNQKLQEKAQKVARMMQKRPFSPQEKLLKTIDFLGEFDSLSHLLPRGRKLSYIAYYNIDILLIFISLLAVLIYGTYLLALGVLRRLFKASKVKSQ